jgi:glutamate dehydrogenase
LAEALALPGRPALAPAVVNELQRLLSHFSPEKPLALALWHDADKPVCHLGVAALDQPFLTDTVTLCARRLGLDIADLRHPVLTVQRDENGDFKGLVSTKKGRREALIYLALPPLTLNQGEQLQAAVRAGVRAAVASVKDFEAMRGRIEEEAARMAATRQGRREELQFLTWLLDNHFILLGMRQYQFRDGKGGRYVQMVPGSGLGILRYAPSRAEQPVPVAKLGENLGGTLAEAGAVMLSKTFDRAPIHRDAAMDYVGLRRFDARQQVESEWRVVGLFTSSAYTTHVGSVPLLSGKLAAVREKLNYEPNNYSARVLQNVLETWPRDELFLTDANELARLAAQAVAVRERPDVAVLLRVSAREQAVSVQVLVPMARYESRLRRELAELLARLSGGEVTDQRLEMGDLDLVRLFFRLHIQTVKQINTDALNREVRRLVRGWADEVQHLLYQNLPVTVAAKLWQNIGNFLPADYRAGQTPEQAAADLLQLQQLPEGGAVRLENTGNSLILRAYRRGNGWPLHQILPVLAGFGLKTAQEQHFTLPLAGAEASIQVIEIEGEYNLAPEVVARVGTLVGQGLRGEAENDSLNGLVISADLPLESIPWLRAWTACLQQADRRFGGRTVRAVLTENPSFAKDLVALFRARLEPGHDFSNNSSEIKKLNDRLAAAAARAASAENEKICMTFHELIMAMVRTNAWQVNEKADVLPALAFKFDGARLTLWPKPLVWREIFVYHPLVEGVHLRGGPVARGGIRYSDRPYDYRLEILGLQQAQQRKNTIIVPVGAKGGFVVKSGGAEGRPADGGRPMDGRRAAGAQTTGGGRAGGEPQAGANRVVEAYRIFIAALLSVTDNHGIDLETGVARMVPPRGVTRLDGDDAYLVVAADKGTASFSDTANDVAQSADYWDGAPGGFWLGDAFASGGASGYDHKALAITARGAWVSVQHHLKALEIEPGPGRPLLMAGVGDMAGDVFGNGLLREPWVQLIGAFNHKHIFLDPDPAPEASLAERRRLFAAGLGWDGYDAAKLSAGGGVWARSAKSVPLHPRIQARLGLKKASATPDEVIRAILKAPVDVLWNGGIGTFIRAGDERDEDVGDKANDAIRVEAREVRARIIGEGGNLGVTPRGRVELSRKGVRLNSDAVDNSAGVDTSDHEVNLKILCGLATRHGDLTRPARNQLLHRLTGAVAEAVLADNARQNLAISLEAAGNVTDHRDLFALQQELLKKGVLDPEVDTLPTLAQLLQREGERHAPAGYTRPELAGLLAGAKTVLREELLQPGMAEVLASSIGSHALRGYFPAELPQAVARHIAAHPLGRDIAATVLANRVVNRLGLLLVPRLSHDLGTTPAAALQAVLLAEDWLVGPGFWQEMDALEPKLPMAALLAVSQRVRTVTATLAAWLVQHEMPLEQALGELGPAVRRAAEALPKLLSPGGKSLLDERVRGWKKLGLPAPLAVRLSLLSPLAVVPDAVLLGEQAGRPVDEILRLQLALGEALQLPALIQKSRQAAPGDGWSRQAMLTMMLEFLHRQRRLTEALVAERLDLAGWKKRQAGPLARYHKLVAQVLGEKSLSVAMMSVVLGRLRELVP